LDRGLNVELRRRGPEEPAGLASELLLHVQTGFRVSADAAAFGGEVEGSESGACDARTFGSAASLALATSRQVLSRDRRHQPGFALDSASLTFPAVPYVDQEAGLMASQTGRPYQ
jgi:hypothetical protein